MAEILSLLTAIFVVSSAMIFLMDRLSYSALPAYILSGVIVGFFFEQQEQIIALSQLGIAFLVFIFGLKTEPERIKSVAVESASTTFVQVGVIGAGAYLFARGLGMDLLNTSYIVTAAALSSSLVGLELAEKEIRIDLLHGRLSESMHLVQDLIAIGAVLVLSIPKLTPSAVATSLLDGTLLIAAALVVRSTVFPEIADRVGDSTELTMFTGIAVLAGFIGAASIMDISIVVGSFAAGMAVAHFPYNMELLENMGSLKDFFSAIFFVSLGALATLPSIESLFITLFLVLVTSVLKPGITVLSLLASGYDRRTSYLTALSLDQVSEFGLIIAIQAFIAGTIHPEVFNAVVLAAAFTMITSSYTSRHEELIYRTVSRYSRVDTSRKKIEEWTNVGDLDGHVILIGYDPQGKEIADALEEESQEFVVVENDPEKVIEARKNEENYVFGDVMDEETWRKARVEKARLIVSTVPSYKVSKKVLQQKEADKILRAKDIPEAEELLHEGALYVEVPDIVAAEELIDHIRGVTENLNYREELRRRNLLEIRKYLQSEE